MSRCILSLICAAAMATVCEATADASSDRAIAASANQLVQAMVRGDFEGATANFDANMRKTLSAEGLKKAWESLTGALGPYRGVLGNRSRRQGKYRAVYVVCRLGKAIADVKVVFEPEGMISGLFFEKYDIPEYVDLDTFEERPARVGGGKWALPGTLSLPKGRRKSPGVVLVHGSGPQDREESIGPNKPFRDLAWGLASRGIAVLRYDKRTLVHFTEVMAAVNTFTTKEESIDDALAAAELLRATPEINARQIYVLGHSFGGSLLPRIGKRDPSLAGLIVMAGLTRPLEDALLQQMHHMASADGRITPDEQRQLDRIKRQVVRVKSPTLSPAMPARMLPFGLPASYWLDIRGYHPGKAARKLNIPMLVLHGARDSQLTAEDLAGWKRPLSSRTDVTCKVYLKLNHLMFEGEGKPSLKEYQRPGHVDADVIDDIAEWILRANKRRPGPTPTMP